MTETETSSSQDVDQAPVAVNTWLVLLSLVLVALAITTIVLVVQVHRLRAEVTALSARDFSDGGAAGAEAPEICRTLGALAARHDIPLERIFTDQVQSDCEQQAREGAAAVASQ